MDEHEDPAAHVTTRPLVFRGRGAVARPDGRYESMRREAFDGGWGNQDEEHEVPATELIVDTTKRIINHNDSPDISFGQSINPYRGCEHGCTYCFARPTHSYLGLSAGLDFETKIAWKPDAAKLLRAELSRKSYVCVPIVLGINTDAWQPIERKLGITRAILEVLAECRHPVSMVTKGALIERDIDLLADLARDNLVQVMFSVTSLDRDLARRMEPRAATPQRRLEIMAAFHDAGIPVGVLFAPLIPALNDHDMETVFEMAKARGAELAGYTLLRLPHELADLFPEWLRTHFPERAEHVLSLVRQLRGGKLNDPNFGSRMRGEGLFADMYEKRARLAIQRLGLNKTRRVLETGLFRPPRSEGPQLQLF